MDTHTSRRATRWQPTTQEWGLAAYEETKVKFIDLVLNSDRPRAQAYALWALSHDATLSGRELFDFRTGCGSDEPDPEQVEKARRAVRQLRNPHATQEEPAATQAPQAWQAPQAPQAPQERRMREETPAPGAEPGAADRTAPPEGEAAAGPKRKRSGGGRNRKGKGLSKMEKAILANFSDASKTIAAYKDARQALARAQRKLDKACEQVRRIETDKARLLAQLDPQAATVLRELGVVD